MKTLFTEAQRQILRIAALREWAVNVDPFHVEPPHEAFDDEKWERIARRMFLHDWKGNPLPALYYGGTDYRALTGSHRIEAARQTNLTTIPLIVTDGLAFEALTRESLGIEGHANLEDILYKVQLNPAGATKLATVARKAGLRKFASVLKAEHGIGR